MPRVFILLAVEPKLYLPDLFASPDFLSLVQTVIFLNKSGETRLGDSRTRLFPILLFCWPSRKAEAVQKKLTIWKQSVDRQLNSQPKPRGSSLCIGRSSSRLWTGVQFRYFAIENHHFVSWISPCSFCSFCSCSQHWNFPSVLHLNDGVLLLGFACVSSGPDTPRKEQVVACRRTPPVVYFRLHRFMQDFTSVANESKDTTLGMWDDWLYFCQQGDD